MNVKNILFFFLLVSVSFKLNAQNLDVDSAEYVKFDCEIIQTKQKLSKKSFASTPPIQLRVDNEELNYAIFQLGKRKNKMYLYLRIMAENVCIKKDKNVDIHFKSGEVITLKNDYVLNCESFFARQLSKKELEKIKSDEMTMIKVYAYDKNYEFLINTIKDQNIKQYINCLEPYKISDSNEVKIKR